MVLKSLLIAGLALMLLGCAHSPGKLQVQITDECSKHGKQVPAPQIGEDSDYRELSVDALSALGTANRRIAARDKCEREVRDDYAKAG